MKKYLIIIGLAVISFACSDSFLENELYSSDRYTEAYKTPKDIHNAVLGVYNAMNASSLYGRNFLVFGELRSDNLYNNGSGGRFKYVGDYAINSRDADVWDLWVGLYSCIGKCNNVIDNETVKEDKEVLFYKAQAKALRAYCYFDLHRLFSQYHCENNDGKSVPLRLIYTTKENLNPESRATTEKVKEQIVKDLTESLIDIKLMSAPKYEITEDAVKALCARVYLYFGDYRKSAKYSKEIIDTKEYDFFATNVYESQFFSKENKESIFELAFTSSDNLGTASYPMLYEQDGYNQFSFVPDVLNQYSENDVRYPYIGKDITKKELKKFPVMTQADVPIKLIRYAEVVYNYIEALVKLNEVDDDAVSLLNEMLIKRGVEEVEKTDIDIDLILSERRKEFIGEGHRYFDLIRNGRTITTYTDKGVENTTIEYPDDKLALPIPQNEIERNINISDKDQNYGY